MQVNMIGYKQVILTWLSDYYLMIWLLLCIKITYILLDIVNWTLLNISGLEFTWKIRSQQVTAFLLSKFEELFFSVYDWNPKAKPRGFVPWRVCIFCDDDRYPT